MNKIAAYELLLNNHPLWTKEAIFLSPAHAATILAGPGVLGGAAGAAGAGEGNRLEGALRGMGAGYGGMAAGLALKDPTGVPSVLIGSPAAGYVAGRTVRSLRPKRKKK